MITVVSKVKSVQEPQVQEENIVTPNGDRLSKLQGARTRLVCAQPCSQNRALSLGGVARSAKTSSAHKHARTLIDHEVHARASDTAYKTGRG